ncbi:hypothetical protein [Ruegeria jejuensis]|uniref:hypothetical protein n=1 Tax=Ruegeria jejuensis TaxID=3233338 RepID=UPI00355BC8D3
MSPLAAMKADAQLCNRRMRRSFGIFGKAPERVAPREVSKHIVQRREAVRGLREQGLTTAKIARALKVSNSIVKYDLAMMRREV